MFIGLSPYIGFHTIMAIFAAYIFNLPIYPLILGAYITNPLTLVIVYAFLYKLGVIITGVHFSNIDWSNITFSVLLNNLKTLFWPLFVGCHLAGFVVSLFTYIVVYYIIKKNKVK
jgi:uncharacterized protein (DUF2062 family)